jgi:hypothetical protein
MKYGNTSRTLSFVFHLLILLAFGVLGLYYGIFVTPLYWTANNTAFTYGIYPFNFDLELAVLGLSLFAVSIYGLVQAVLALQNPTQDDHVIKSFVAFIVEGYIGAIFCLANACIYFDLLSFGSISFIVVMGLLLGIILLIAANIPMVRIFDGNDSTPLLSGLSLGAGVFFGFTALELLASLFGAWNRGSFSYYYQVTSVLGYSALALGVVAACAIVAGVLIGKKKLPNSLTLGGILDSAAIALVGAVVVGNGVFDFVYREKPDVHFEGKGLAYTGLAYPVCAMVFGGLIAIAGVAFLIITLKDNKKAASVAK